MFWKRRNKEKPSLAEIMYELEHQRAVLLENRKAIGKIKRNLTRVDRPEAKPHAAPLSEELYAARYECNGKAPGQFFTLDKMQAGSEIEQVLINNVNWLFKVMEGYMKPKADRERDITEPLAAPNPEEECAKSKAASQLAVEKLAEAIVCYGTELDKAVIRACEKMRDSV